MSKTQDRNMAVILYLMVLTVCGCITVPATSEKAPQHKSGNGNALSPNHSQILIIGAGSSGVAAASRLMLNGILDVTILEAEDRLGGRTHSIPFGEDVVDLGAQWVHGVQGNVVYEMANPLGLLEENATGYHSNARYLQGNGVEIDKNLMEGFSRILNSAIGDDDFLAKYNGSFGQLHDEKFAELTSHQGLNASTVSAYKNWVEKVFAFGTGSDSWYSLSTKWMAQNRGCPGHQYVNWIKNGYYSVINLLTRKYPSPENELPVRNKTHLRTEVKTIHWGPKKVDGPDGKKVVLVETSDGAKFTANFVVVTVPLGVLKENALTMFDPPVPDRKMNAIKHVGFGQTDKLYLHFNETWWPSNLTGFSIIPTEEDRQRFNSLYPQFVEKGEWTNGLTGFYRVTRQPQHVLFDWIVGEPARNMEKYTDEEVKNGCMRWLEMFLNQTIPDPVSFARSKWYSNPHFRGSYSHRSLDSDKHDAQYSHIAEPLVGSDRSAEVFFAGEATHEGRFSTVNGAIETGWREADRILNLLGSATSSIYKVMSHSTAAAIAMAAMTRISCRKCYSLGMVLKRV